jgi:uncharacterized repeat protein (TIGR01451 family)
MKKLTLLFLVLFLKFAPAKAQWVTIPDANFVTKLTQFFPSCMNGNQMDTTCAGIVSEDSLNVSFSGITDLSGIEYFVNLQILNCNLNQLTSLPVLPSSLEKLSCGNNLLTSLPALPNSLIDLDCIGNSLSNLPVLPNSLNNLICENNQLTSLPVLPSSLEKLFCGVNQLTSLPALPNSLTILDFNLNQITSLPALPNSLTGLYCYNNQLISFPTFPNSLTSISCGYNQLINLPTLPNSLTHLYCGNNQLTSLPAIPNSLIVLYCNNNQLTSLPFIPGVLDEFYINDNNILCLENLPIVNLYYNTFGNPFTCIPNQPNYNLGLPLCLENDTVNNPNNCPGVNITGNIFKDLNSNCAYNLSDLPSQNIPVKLYDNQNNFLVQSFTVNGVYGFNILLPDTYQVKIDTSNLPLTIACGQNSTQSVTLTSTNQTIQNINFPVVCNAAYDATVQSVTPQGWVFPGQTHTLKTNVTNNSNWYNLNCSSILVSGTVNIQVNGPVSFVAPTAGALTPTVNGNTYTYTISDFNTLNPNSFGLRMITDTTAQATDQVCVHVEIFPNLIDADTTNNVYDFCYNVVNSYDPNMKEVYPVNVLPGYDDWFTYTIHFQNTGNAPAFNIRLRDTLDTQLDLNTFEVLGYSHPANVTVSGNILTVRFNNIMLPDSTTDYEGSMGYFQYRLKPFPNLPLGSQISNTAYIYFDYNAPIVTNTTENNFDITVPVKSLVTAENSFSLFPNPSTGVFTFKDTKNLNFVEVYSILGEKVLSQTNQKTINLNGFSKGVYFARVNGIQVVKLVKE